MRYAKRIIAAASTIVLVSSLTMPAASAMAAGPFLRPALDPATSITSVPVHPAFSRQARDMNGYEPSLYRGKWYQKSAEPVRKCIMARESRFGYRVRNSTSSAAGAYQFLDSQWRWPLTYMLIEEERSLPGKPNRAIINEIKDLRNKNISQWNRYWQDRAFWTAWRFGAGAKHWYHPGIRCF